MSSSQNVPEAMDTNTGSRLMMERETASRAWNRKRAAFVCRICRSRKVKCNVSDAGPPCQNCHRDGLRCEVVMGTGYRATAWKHKQQALSDANLDPSRCSPNPTALDTSLEWRPEQPNSLSHCPNSQGSAVLSLLASPEGSAPNNGSRTVDSRQSSDVTDEGENSKIFAVPFEGSRSGEDTMPFYIGDHRASSFLTRSLNLGVSSNHTHFIVPLARSPETSAEEIAYLQAKGVFKLPSEQLLSAAFRCFFSYALPFLPIVDPGTFLRNLDQDEPEQASLLLVWSILFVAGSFIDESILCSTGFASRKELKRVAYSRAQSLFALEFEKDRMTLIQSAILLSFWTNNADDRTGSWHWNGVAISLCHGLGMHHHLQPNQLTQRFPSVDDCRRWRLIWWTCYCREVWLSFALGRPMRVNAKDCDQPWPSISDIESLAESIPSDIKHKYLVEHADNLSYSTGRWMKLTKALGEILETRYRPGQSDWSNENLEAEEQVIRLADSTEFGQPRGSDAIYLLCDYQLDLCLEAVVIALYRPCILGKRVEGSSGPDSHTRALQRVKIAASNSNSSLNKLTSLNLISLCQSYAVISLLSVMQIHILECDSASTLSRNVASRHLDMCMTVLEELRKTYWGADFSIKFYTAIRKLLPSTPSPTDFGTVSETHSVEPGVQSQSQNSGPDMSPRDFTPFMAISSNLAWDELSNSNDLGSLLSSASFGQFWGV